MHSCWLLLWLDNIQVAIVGVDPGNLKGEIKSGDKCIM